MRIRVRDDGVAIDASPEVSRLLDEILKEAIRERASDLHFEPSKEGGLLRFRIDGLLGIRRRFDRGTFRALIDRIKLLSALDVEEQRLPQDGRILLSLEGEEEVSLRVGIGPNVQGEGACLRVLTQSAFGELLAHPDQVFQENLRATVRELASLPYGLVIVTGPTGCGKTTSLYALLAMEDREKVKLVTVEDPVEIQIEGVTQLQIQPALGLGFPAAIRHLLRMDPDVLLCGEVRDEETAALLLKVAITGHLVLASLHTSNALEAIQRLGDIGLEPYLLADALQGVLGQRLLRRLCPACCRPDERGLERLREIHGDRIPAGARILAPGGCKECSGSGYRGRLAVQELLRITPALKSALQRRVSPGELELLAGREGFRDFSEQALPLLLDGSTSLLEVLRVCPPRRS